MIKKRMDLPERDAQLGRVLAEVVPVRARTEAEWAALEARIVAGAALRLARRRRGVWYGEVAVRSRALLASAAMILLVLGGMLYWTPRTGGAYGDGAGELVEVLGEEEVRLLFPGLEDTDVLLAAALTYVEE
jgi:hypothetical protein